MPTLVYADAQDDTSSIRIKLEGTRDEAVGLVVPKENRALISPISVRVIARHAEVLGMEIAVISRNGALRRAAEEEGLATYSSPEKYTKALAVRVVEPETSHIRESLGSQLRHLPRLMRAFLLLALLGFGFGLAYVLVPSATVTVAPRTEVVNGVVEVVADPGIQSVSTKDRQVPARVIYLLVEATDQSPTGEGRPAEGNRAVGMVTFTNRNASEMVVPVGSIVSTLDGVRFKTETEVKLKGGLGNTGQTQVTALFAGAGGNVDRLTIKSIEGMLQHYVLVQNEEPTAGGGDRAVVTTLDRDHLQEKAVERAKKEALQKLATMVQGRELLVQESFEFTPLEVSFDRAIGQEAQTLNIQMKARVAATLVNQDDVEEVTRANWKPNPRPGFQLTAEGVRILPPEVVKVDGRVVRLASKAEARTVAQVNVARVQQFARWRSSAESEAELATLFDLVRPPEVRIDPGWADRAYRVWVVVDAGEPR